MENERTDIPSGPGSSALTDVARNLARIINRESFPSGMRAALRRLRPGQVWPMAFWDLALAHIPEDLLRSETQERQWAVVMQAMALMAPVGQAGIGLGTALARVGGDTMRHRLMRLVQSRDQGLEDQIRLTARLLASHDQAVDQTDFARLLLYPGETAVRVRRELVRSFLSACSKAAACPKPDAPVKAE
ncbi:type I-E CRISPR-associated protein Cse2/CasB [Fundidesulfovibrio putealis]|uniref:type I-E CRISPR-associated protein Cse2/CasB n=1 Tax=Fundidesulfovibrio putealis TaxID=270496 RepID=UPI0004150067|nr:type I-E CRISPR-associated protein Cse2/CasB [Fundidesulfovibrio putealis]